MQPSRRIILHCLFHSPRDYSLLVPQKCMCRFSCHGFDAICEPKAFILKFALCVAFFPFFSRSLCIFFAVSLSLSLSLSLDFLSVGFFLFLFITILLVYVWSSVDSLYAYNYFIPFRSFFVRLFHCHFILRQMIVYMCFSFLFCSFPFARSLTCYCRCYLVYLFCCPTLFFESNHHNTTIRLVCSHLNGQHSIHPFRTDSQCERMDTRSPSAPKYTNEIKLYFVCSLPDILAFMAFIDQSPISRQSRTTLSTLSMLLMGDHQLKLN